MNEKKLEKYCEDDGITHDSDHISYPIFLEDFKDYVRLINTDFKITIHSLRNTACVLEMFANGHRQNMRKSA